MATLSRPGVNVNVIDETVSGAVSGFPLIPLFVIATEQDKANSSGTGIAPSTTKDQANKIKLMTSTRSLINEYGLPRYLSVGGTIQQGSELNEHGLLGAYKALTQTGRAYVVRADVDLAQLAGSSVAPSGSPVTTSYWLDTVSTNFGVHKYVNGVWTKINPKIITDATLLDNNNAPKNSYPGNNGDFAVVAVSSEADYISLYERIAGAWYLVGKSDWLAATPTVVESSSFTTRTARTDVDSGVTLPSGGDTIDINGNSVTFEVRLANTADLYENGATTANFVADSASGTFGGLTKVASSFTVNGEAIDLSGAVGAAPTLDEVIAAVNVGTGTHGVTASLLDAGVAAAPQRYGILLTSSTGNITLADSTDVVSGMGFTSATEYKPSLYDIVSVINDAAISDVTASAVAVPSSSAYRLNITYALGTTMTISNDSVTQGIGLTTAGNGDPESFRSGVLVFAPHTQPPLSPVAGDIWVKTTSSANGADWSVKLFNTTLGQWTEVSSPLYANTTDAFDAYAGTITSGSLFVQYDPNEDTTAQFALRRYNGNEELNVRLEPFAGADLDVSGTLSNLRFDLSEDGVSYTTINITGVTDASTKAEVAEQIAAAINSTYSGFIQSSSAGDFVTITNRRGRDVIIRQNPLSPTATDFDLDEIFVDVNAGSDVEVVYSNWVILSDPAIASSFNGYEAGSSSPVNAPEDGTLWYDTDLSKVDILEHNGTTWETFSGEIFVQANEPSVGVSPEDIWVDTSDLDEYPNLYRYRNNEWITIDMTDQSTPDGIIFADARESVNSSSLDSDAPNPVLYPRGILLWNTRGSGYVVKSYNSLHVDGPRWELASGLRTDGSLYAGRYAQRNLIVQKMRIAMDTDAVRSMEDYQFTTVLAPGFPEVIPDMVELSTARKNTVFVIGDTPSRLAPNGTDIQAWALNTNDSPVTDDRGLTVSSENVALYYPSRALTDNVDGTIVSVPSSIAGLMAFIRNDLQAYQWFAPAGRQRGNISGIFSSVGFINNEGEFEVASMSEGLQEVAYVNRINPLVSFAGRGVTVWGQKTLLADDSSTLSRINVSRLVIYLRQVLNEIGLNFVFEPGDNQTFDRAEDVYTRILGDMVSKRAISDFLVVCDSSNNTTASLAARELNIDLFIAPINSVEFISVNLILRNEI